MPDHFLYRVRLVNTLYWLQPSFVIGYNHRVATPLNKRFFIMRVSYLSLLAILAFTATIVTAEPITIGSRLELFVDDALIESIDGAELRIHHPQPKEVCFVRDEPWEGSGSGYDTVFQDGDLYRMYYKAW